MSAKMYKHLTYVEAVEFDGTNIGEIAKFVKSFVQKDENSEKARFYVRGKKFTIRPGSIVVRSMNVLGEPRFGVYKPELFHYNFEEIKTDDK